MSSSTSTKTKRRKFAPLGILFAVLGLLLFSYFIKKAGIIAILEDIKRVGVGFLLILLVSGLKTVARTLAWMKCFEPPFHLKFLEALKARFMGDALGNLVPFGTMVVSEPAKAALVRDRVPLMASVSALAVENLFYSLSVALFIFFGAAALLFRFPLPRPLMWASYSALAGVIVVIILLYLIVRLKWRFLSRTIEFLYARGVAQRALETRRVSVRTLEDQVYGFYERNGSRFIPILLLESCFHLCGIIEGYITLAFISDMQAPTLLTAFILESVNRIITVVFKFIPLRAGVDEAGTGMLARVLGFGTPAGVTLAIIRKARDIWWTGVGLALLFRRGLSVRSATEEAEAAMADEATISTGEG